MILSKYWAALWSPPKKRERELNRAHVLIVSLGQPRFLINLFIFVKECNLFLWTNVKEVSNCPATLEVLSHSLLEGGTYCVISTMRKYGNFSNCWQLPITSSITSRLARAVQVQALHCWQLRVSLVPGLSGYWATPRPEREVLHRSP